jgi:hypothetical protein
MPPDYRQQLETFYSKKSQVESKHLKTLHPKKTSKKKITENKLNESFQIIHQQIDNPYTIENHTLNRQFFINENTLLENLNYKIVHLTNKVKEYELDILFELHDSIEEYDATLAELDKIKKKYKEIMDHRKNRIRKEELVKEQKKSEINRLLDSYRMASELVDKRDAYESIRDKSNKYFEEYNRTDIISEKQRVLVDDENEKNKDETNIIVHRCVVNYEPIIDIDVKFSK